LWDPSQKGLLVEAPHRHRKKGLPSRVGIELPSWSWRVTFPSTLMEPFRLKVSFTSDMMVSSWWMEVGGESARV
jgi:hypothetical protein